MPQSWESYIRSEEDSNWKGCFNAAKLDGHSQEEAENCDNGSLKCIKCPFK